MVGFHIEGKGFDELVEMLQATPDALWKELRTANERIGAKVNSDARRILSEQVYSVPIPFTKAANRGTRGSKPLSDRTKDKLFNTSTQKHRGRSIRKWDRTANLLNRERYVLTLALQGAQAVILVNDAAYGVARNDLGLPGKRRAGTQRPQADVPAEERSQTRSIQWQVKAVEMNKPWIRAEYEQAMARAFGSRGLQ